METNIGNAARNRKDLSGRIFGRLTVLSYHSTINKRPHWTCQCTCGNTHIANGKYLSNGDTKSCGCLQADAGSARAIHGESHPKTKEYRTWKGIKTRCYGGRHHKFPIYGGRGITVCERWLDSYVDFLADMGRAPSPTHSIDRIDVNGNYEPGNCRWATPKEQANNRRIYSKNGYR